MTYANGMIAITREQRNAMRCVKMYKNRIEELEQRRTEIRRMNRVMQMLHANELKNIDATVEHFRVQMKKYKAAML